MEYTYGYNDIFCIIFYTLVCVVAHGVIQQYLLDRSVRKLHMSKIKHSKFNESGQLLTFFVFSILWAMEILRRDRMTKKSFIEVIAGGQQDVMSHGTKMYFIIQLSYWLHCYPEFYLQRVRKEEVSQRVLYVSLYLMSFLCAYLLNVTRITLVLALLHYTGEATFHMARLMYFRQNGSYSSAFKLWNVSFVAARLISITLSVLVLALGWGSNAGLQQASGLVVSPSIIAKYSTLFIILVVQIYLMWKYLVFHLGRMRPVDSVTASNKNK